VTAVVEKLADLAEELGCLTELREELARRGTLPGAGGENELRLERQLRAVLQKALQEDTAHRSAIGSPWMSVKAVAEHAGVSPKTVRRWIGGGSLSASKVGSQWRIREADMESFLRTSADRCSRPFDAEAEADKIVSMRRARRKK